MSLSLADQYYLKAHDNYIWNIEETVESLNYALSYDEEHAASNCLMGRLLMEKLKRFDEAAHYFELALLADPNYVDTYKHFSRLLIWLGKLDRAEKLIQQGAGKKGMSKLIMIKRSAALLEAKGQIDLAIKEVRRGRLLSSSDIDYNFFNAEKDRLKRKIKKHKKKGKKNKK